MRQQDQQSPQTMSTRFKKERRSQTLESTPVQASSKSETLIKAVSEQKIQDMLHLIFEHFCKRSYDSKPNTFDHIKHQVMVLTLNKFMIFCRQFGFLVKRMISMIDLVTLFRKFSTNFKEMNYNQFRNSLIKLGEQCYKGEDNSERKLLQYMKMTNQHDFIEQMRKLKISIPEKLIAPKHIQNFKIYSHGGKFSGDIKKELEIRKEKKIVKSHSVDKKHDAISPTSANSTKYSTIHANRTKSKFELNSIVGIARQETQYNYSNGSRNYQSMKGATHLQNLIEEEQDDVLEQLERKQQRYKSLFANPIQQRINKLQIVNEREYKRVATQITNRRR